MSHRSQLSAYVLIPALLLGLLTVSWNASSAWATSGSSGDPGEPGSSSVTSVSSVSCSGDDPCSSSSVSIVSCSGDTCSVTMSGTSLVGVLGTTFSVERIENGQATLRVGDQEVSCSAGQSLSVGGLRLTCTSVTTDTVAFTVTRG